MEQSSQKYKALVDKKRREVHFKVGDKVWAYLRKERLHKDQHTKLQMKKIGPCTILHKFGENAYEITLPPSLSISPIFNIFDLTPFKGNVDMMVPWMPRSHMLIGCKNFLQANPFSWRNSLTQNSTKRPGIKLICSTLSSGKVFLTLMPLG